MVLLFTIVILVLLFIGMVTLLVPFTVSVVFVTFVPLTFKIVTFVVALFGLLIAVILFIVPLLVIVVVVVVLVVVIVSPEAPLLGTLRNANTLTICELIHV